MSTSVIEKARAHIVLDHPFFASILLRHPMKTSDKVERIMVSTRGQITYNPAWMEALPVKQAIFALCHEILHYASMHGLRKGSREMEQWNEACDQWINETLVNLNIGEAIEGCCRSPGAHESTPENLYDIIMARPPSDGNGPGQGNGNGQGDGQGQPPPPGAGQGQGDDPLSNDIEPPPPGMTDGEKSEQEANTKLEVAEAGQAAKMRGNLPGLLQQFIAATVDSKVPWYDVLERFMSEKVQQDQSWSRPNRRYMPAAYLPTMQSIGAMGELVVQVDISGSVSRKEIEYYNGHLKRIVELCNPTKVHVIYTDTEVQHHDEFEQGEEFEITFHSGGGTDMRAGVNWVEEQGIDCAVMVTLTDGYTPFPEENGSFPTIWCISSDDIKSPTGETIPFTMHEA